MSDETWKKVDESWKDRVEHEKVEHEKQEAPATSPQPSAEKQAAPASETPEARFDLFVSGLAMDALIALGDTPHPTTRKPAMSLPHARYLIDLLGVLEEKTRGNLTADEERLLKDALYQLRMRYLAKAG